MSYKITIGISFSPELIDKIDRFISEEKSRTPALKLNRSSFVRLAAIALIESRRPATGCTGSRTPGSA